MMMRIKASIKKYSKRHISLWSFCGRWVLEVVSMKNMMRIATYHDQGLIPFKTLSFWEW
jgi:hypothetical protein